MTDVSDYVGPTAPLADVFPVIDLTVDETSAEELLAEAVARIDTLLPGWSVDASRQDFAYVLLEAVAVVDYEVILDINRLAPGLLEGVLTLFGVPRDNGAMPTGSVTLTLTDTLGHDIGAGLELGVDLDNGSTAVFLTKVTVAIPPGSSAGTVDIVGIETGNEANGIAAGQTARVLGSSPYVLSGILAADITGGRGPESDVTYYARARTRLARLNDTLSKPSHYRARALEEPGVSIAAAINNYDPHQDGLPGTHGGHITIPVFGPTGPLTTDAMQDLEDSMLEDAAANQRPHVVAPTVVPVDITATVVAKAGYDPIIVRSGCVVALTAYLSPVAWPFTSTLYYNELISLLDRVPGVERVSDITTPAGDVVFTGAATLATPGTFNIAVI